MQKFLLNLAGLSLLTASLFFTSCGEDPIVTDPLGPDIQFLSDTDVLSADADVIIGENFTVRLKISKGDNPLKSIEVQEGGTKLDLSRITYISTVDVINNPFTVAEADKDGVTYDVTITQGTHAVGDYTIYKFIVTDEKNETSSVDIAITTAALPGTPLSMTITGVLFNQAGPTGTGGLDLDVANGGTGSSDPDAELRDLGLDCTIAVGSENWRGQMGTINGADMVKVDLSQVENFTFDAVDKKEPIADVYNSGITLADGASVSCSSGNSTSVTDVTDVIVVGDMFVVFANSNYYLIRIDEVNQVAGSNGDNYKLSIKY